jgi:hypothetical protein
MDLSNPQAFSGLEATASPRGSNVSNSVRLGKGNASTALSSATKIVTFDAMMQGSSSDLVVDVSDLDSTGTTAWSAGTIQVETATAAGTITGSGNAEVVVTAANVPGSPLTFSVAVESGDLPAAWAAKVRTALAADATLSQYFDVVDAGALPVIKLSSKPTLSHTIQGESVGAYPANDATLNVSLDNDTCTGITTAATSVDTIAGVASSGVYVPALDGNDFEGIATGGATDLYGIYIKNSTPAGGDAVFVTMGSIVVDYPLPAQGILQISDASGDLNLEDITITPETNDPSIVEVVIAAS